MNHIKFLGLTLSWDVNRAAIQAKYLKEIGYGTKLVELENRFVVAYSPLDFRHEDAIQALVVLLEGVSRAAGETNLIASIIGDVL
jgi:hypothetical protein